MHCWEFPNSHFSFPIHLVPCFWAHLRQHLKLGNDCKNWENYQIEVILYNSSAMHWYWDNDEFPSRFFSKKFINFIWKTSIFSVPKKVANATHVIPPHMKTMLSNYSQHKDGTIRKLNTISYKQLTSIVWHLPNHGLIFVIRVLEAFVTVFTYFCPNEMPSNLALGG